MKVSHTYILITAGLALLAGGTLLFSSNRGFPSFKDLPQGCATGFGEDKEAEVDFEKEGRLLINNPGLKEDTLYLVYEEPGSPGINLELIFDQESLCYEEEAVSCSKVIGRNAEELAGRKVKVQGEKEPDGVVVGAMYFLED